MAFVKEMKMINRLTPHRVTAIDGSKLSLYRAVSARSGGNVPSNGRQRDVPALSQGVPAPQVAQRGAIAKIEIPGRTTHWTTIPHWAIPKSQSEQHPAGTPIERPEESLPPPGGGEICLPALPAAPYPPLRPGANTTTPAATSTAGGDDPAAITTPAGESDTNTPATPADGGVGDATPPAADGDSQPQAGGDGSDDPPDIQATQEEGGDDTPPR